MQKELFAKEFGREMSASAHEIELRRAQDEARKIASMKGAVSINDVREALPHLSSGNYLGSVFKGKEWIFTGAWEAARHKGSHARMVRVWALKVHKLAA